MLKQLLNTEAGVFALIALLIGVPFLAVAGGYFYLNNFRTRDWPVVEASVVTLRVDSSIDSEGRSGTSYCPIVAFTTTTGEPMEVDSGDCTSPSVHAAGDTVKLRYNPADAEEVQLIGGLADVLSLVFVWGFGALGLALVVAAGLAVRAGLRLLAKRGHRRRPAHG